MTTKRKTTTTRPPTPAPTRRRTAASMPPAVERVLAVAQAMPRNPRGGSDEDHDILQNAAVELRRALPVATQILLSSLPFDSVNQPLESYVFTRTRQSTDDDRAIDEREAIYFVGIAVGLLLAEVV